MKFSYNWLTELVDGIEADAQELSRLITMKTAESEGVETAGECLATVIAVRVLSAEPIPNSKNVVAVIDAGKAGKRTVVCGAPNCRAGIVTAWVPPGTKIEGREIHKAVINGVESDGMLAAGVEIGLNRDHAGILELDLEPGTPLPCKPDSIIEIDNKSLTHRPDLWGHYGMGREVSAITGKRLKDPVNAALLPLEGNSIGVEIEDYTLCPRYSALVFDNVTVQPSPLWLQYRLQSIGLNPINNIVDVTNLVMAELAQPMHAFDRDKLHGNTIFVRPARDGETIKALNDETYTLKRSNLVIADVAGPVAIAGVIGGLESAIWEETTRIVFESANFQAASIRKTSSALKLRTDASMRFEKAQDPANTVRGLARAIELLMEVSPGIRLAGGLADSHAERKVPDPIELPLEWLVRKLGRPVGEQEVWKILEALQFGVAVKRPGVLSVSVPSWRATKDISIKDDLVEEVGRMIGYGSITPEAPSLPVRVPPMNEERTFHHAIRELTAAQGFHEVYNYSFLSEETARRFRFDPADLVTVLNPIATDQNVLRPSLVPGIWKNVVENSRYSDNFRLFEIGREIHKKGDDLPDEVTHLAAAFYAKSATIEHLFEMKRLAECLAPGCEVRPGVARHYEHPARTGEVFLNGKLLGRLFEFHPNFVEGGRVGVLDLNLEQLYPLQKKDRRYQALRRFPSSAFDLSVVADARALVGDIQRQITEFAGSGLDAIEFVRQYEGPPLPEGKKSVSYRLTVSATDRTLSSEEVGAVRQKIIDGMRGLGYDLRV